MEATIVYWDYIGTLDRKWKLLHHYRVYIGVILGFYWEGQYFSLVRTGVPGN